MSQPRAIVFVSEARAPELRAVCNAAGLRVVMAGSPDPGRSAAVADALGAQPTTDLRAALAAADVELFLIADPGDFAALPEPADAEAVLAARRRGVEIVALEPIPADTHSLIAAGWLGPASSPGLGSSAMGSTGLGLRAIDTPRQLPLPRSGPGFTEAAELLQHLGPPQAASILCGGTPAMGSLGRRLYDAASLLLAAMGMPEFVDAAVVPPPGDRPRLRSLRGLTGTAMVTARYPDGRAATLTASDRWAAWARRLDLLVPQGRVTITPAGFHHLDPAGSLRDHHDRPTAPTSWTDELAQSIRAVLHARSDPAPRAHPAPIPDPVSVIALNEAALLSARTGQPEPTATILRSLA